MDRRLRYELDMRALATALICLSLCLQVRLHFLSQLLDEAHAHLHATLCASVLGRKLVRLPFHRDVELTPEGAERLLACLTHCMHVRGMAMLGRHVVQCCRLQCTPTTRLSCSTESCWSQYRYREVHAGTE